MGGFRKVDTDFAPLIVTESARSGATHLSTPARVALQDLRAGGCARQEVPSSLADSQRFHKVLKVNCCRLGIRKCSEVAGSDRYQTAAAVLVSLGTSGIRIMQKHAQLIQNTLKPYGKPYYGNAVVEWHESADKCKLLGKTVVLADGLAGVDALAAGWWTSYWQTPIVLHNGTDSLPLVTRNALLTTSIENVIILGGPERISDQIARGSDHNRRSSPTCRRAGPFWDQCCYGEIFRRLVAISHNPSRSGLNVVCSRVSRAGKSPVLGGRMR